MALRIQVLAIVASIFIIITIISLIRRRKLREEYSLMWLMGSVLLIVFALWRNLLDIVANLVGVFYAPAILLLVTIFFGALMFLHITIVISKHTDQNKILTQELALLRFRVDKMTDNHSGRKNTSESNRDH